MARPTDYTPELAASICQALVEGTTLSEVLRWKSMPNRTTVYRWLHRHEDFRRRYTVALELAADELADKVVRIADNATPENASVARLRMDAYPWRASKLAPKKYSDRAIIEDVTAVPVQDLPLMPGRDLTGHYQLLAETEQELGEAVHEGASNADRLKAILASGQPMPPALYATIMKWRKAIDGNNASYWPADWRPEDGADACCRVHGGGGTAWPGGQGSETARARRANNAGGAAQRA